MMIVHQYVLHMTLSPLYLLYICMPQSAAVSNFHSPTMARASLLPTCLALCALLCLSRCFVGSAPQLRQPQVGRQVGVDYLLRNGPKDADPPLINPATAAGPAHEAGSGER